MERTIKEKGNIMIRTNPVRFITRTSLLMLCLALWPSYKMMARDAGASAVLEEIIVTAQKREQSLQEVPISISVVAGTKILEQGFSRLSDLSKFVPNFNVNETTASAARRSWGPS